MRIWPVTASARGARPRRKRHVVGFVVGHVIFAGVFVQVGFHGFVGFVLCFNFNPGNVRGVKWVVGSVFRLAFPVFE